MSETVSISTAAVRIGAAVFTLPRPNRHHNILWWLSALGIGPEHTHNQGFVLSDGRWATREQAAKLAIAAGQVEKLIAAPNLYSEDLWEGGADMPGATAIQAFAKGAPSWRCFHCDEIFADRGAAAEHFGKFQDCQPACKIGVEKFREMEAELASWLAEDNVSARTFYSLGAEHAGALRREEEKGYARGLKDAAHEAEVLDLYEAALAEAEAIFGGEYADKYGQMFELALKAREARAKLVPRAAP